MPESYTAMKKKFMDQGVPEKKAEQKAAKIYNKANPNDTVQPGKYEKKRKSKGRSKESKVRSKMKKAFGK